jgi:LPPG:FO 2-phospho-L-lactate transferase
MSNKKITALAGGVGGAKLVYGLSRILDAQDFNVIVNTGDDFNYYGFQISPDIDSILYSLADVSDPINGFGRKEDSFTVFNTLEDLGDKTWFRLGDKDLALNIKRTQLLKSGMSLSTVTKILCDSLGIQTSVIPMTNDPVYTKIQTCDLGVMDFQEYFVLNKFQPKVKMIFYSNIESAKLTDQAKKVIEDSDVIIICPSNPWLSIFPILGIPTIRELISSKKVVAVSPIIGHNAVKGPTAKLFEEFGEVPSAYGIARLYQSIISTLIIDHQNSDEIEQIEELGIKTHVTDIIMLDDTQKIRLAQEIVRLLGD